VTNCTQQRFSFPAYQRRFIEASFSGGDITSDGGVMLLKGFASEKSTSADALYLNLFSGCCTTQ